MPSNNQTYYTKSILCLIGLTPSWEQIFAFGATHTKCEKMIRKVHSFKEKERQQEQERKLKCVKKMVQHLRSKDVFHRNDSEFWYDRIISNRVSYIRIFSNFFWETKIMNIIYMLTCNKL